MSGFRGVTKKLWKYGLKRPKTIVVKLIIKKKNTNKKIIEVIQLNLHSEMGAKEEHLNASFHFFSQHAMQYTTGCMHILLGLEITVNLHSSYQLSTFSAPGITYSI